VYEFERTVLEDAISVTADIEAAHSAESRRRHQALTRNRGKIDLLLPNHRHNCRGASMQTNSRGTERSNGCQLLWLPPGDLIDTTAAPSCENHEAGKKVDGGVSHMNMRNGSVASFTISKRGNRSFAMGVAVCLRESIGGKVKDRLLQTSPFAYSNICSTPLALVFQQPRNSRPGMRSGLRGRKTRSYNTMYWL
jgi:hypothetical protein